MTFAFRKTSKGGAVSAQDTVTRLDQCLVTIYIAFMSMTLEHHSLLCEQVMKKTNSERCYATKCDATQEFSSFIRMALKQYKVTMCPQTKKVPHPCSRESLLVSGAGLSGNAGTDCSQLR